MKNSILGILFIIIVVSACVYNPKAYQEQKKQEHKNILKQNGY